MQEVILVSALDLNRTIGVDGDLPWHLPADFAHFKAVTRGKPVIMGRLTYESMGQPLPNRRNMVITSRADFSAEGVEAFTQIQGALDVLSDEPEVMIVGGSGIYREGLNYATCLNLTVVHGTFDGDVHFPEIDESAWGIHSVRHLAADEKNHWDCSFYELRRAGENGLKPLPFRFPSEAKFPENFVPSTAVEPLLEE